MRPLRSYTSVQHMPTKHPRIAVTKDAELEAALAGVRSEFTGVPEARVVRDLAIRGAEAIAADEAKRRELIEALVEWSTNPDSSMDRDALRNVKQTAWRT